MNPFDRKFGSDFLGSIPLEPGVYRYFDSSGEVIYVGKAIRLRRRLQQYRNAKRLKKHRKMKEILRAAARIEVTPCSTHEEACLLELEQIRSLRPRLNIASAYSFLYPYIGVRGDGSSLEIFLTSSRTLLESENKISWHGAFRSRHWTREFFGALDNLLSYVAHKTPRTKRQVPRIQGVWSQQYRMMPATLIREIEPFLLGDAKNEFLSELVLSLVENAGARSRRTAVQEDLETCAKFWRRECQSLARVRAASEIQEYPVPQERRDEIFLKFRLSRTTIGRGGL